MNWHLAATLGIPTVAVLLLGITVGYGWGFAHACKGATAHLRASLRGAFMEGRESCSGTDRHRADQAWENSRTRNRKYTVR